MMVTIIIFTLAALFGAICGYFYATTRALREQTGLATALAQAQQREETLKQAAAQQNENMKLWFESTAHKIMQNTSEQSRQQIDVLLTPMKERIEGFQKKVEDVYGKEAEQRISLKAQIEQLNLSNKTLSAEADSLARALKGQSQKRGQWGEMILENILSLSGLKEGVDYIPQGEGQRLRNEEGTLLKPDFIINLCNNRKVVVDSKLSLISYINLTATETENTPEDKTHLQNVFVQSIRNHIKELSGKKYQDQGSLLAHEYVLLFMPIESALALALDLDSELMSFAWSKRVVLVAPSTLLLTLNIINAALQLEKQEQNAQHIALEAANLYEQVRLVIESVNEVDKHLTSARAAHETLVKRLAAGRGNLLRQVEGFRAKGVRVKKEITSLKIENNDITPEDFSDDENETLLPTS